MMITGSHEQFRGQTIYLIGDYLRPHLAGLIRTFLEECGVSRVVLLTETDETAQEMLAAFWWHGESGRLRALGTNGALEETIVRARARFGDPHVVISTPFRPLPRLRPASEAALDSEDVDEIVTQQITHHARVAQQLALVEGARLMVVAPDAAEAAAPGAMLAGAVRTMLRAFAGALSASTARSAQPVAVRQIDLACGADGVDGAGMRRFIATVLGAEGAVLRAGVGG